MSSNDQQSGSNPVPADHAGGAANAAAVDLQSIARRRAIVKGLSKGAALAGAAVPLQTLAASGQRMKLKKTDGKWYQCSVSGNTSVMVSQDPTALLECGAKAPVFYKCNSTVLTDTTAGNWPNWPSRNVAGVDSAVFIVSGQTRYLPTANFATVFGWGDASTSIGTYVNSSPTGDEAQWVTAALNAKKFPNKFPYSVSEVLAMSQLPVDKKAAALAFFREWLNVSQT